MRRLVNDTLIIAERNLVRLPRAPDLLLAFTVQPIMFVLLFRYVFGGAIPTHYANYGDFLVPGIIVQNIAFGGFVTALGLNEDVHKGLIDRFRSLPMARAAVLAGRTLAEALEHFGDRLGLEEARAFAALIQQSDELGASISKALRVYSDDMRHKRMSRAEEKAYSLPAKLAVPMMVCIFPVLFIVILAPVIVRLSTGSW